ncbi:MAG: hypothetical protein ACLQUT_07140 [Thermoleophilia bacterium]
MTGKGCGAGFCGESIWVCVKCLPEFDEELAASLAAEKLATKQVITQTCFNCGRSETEAILVPARSQGDSIWVCVKCLPQLIHG